MTRERFKTVVITVAVLALIFCVPPATNFAVNALDHAAFLITGICFAKKWNL